jgi:hypothetical protein
MASVQTSGFATTQVVEIPGPGAATASSDLLLVNSAQRRCGWRGPEEPRVRNGPRRLAPGVALVEDDDLKGRQRAGESNRPSSRVTAVTEAGWLPRSRTFRTWTTAPEVKGLQRKPRHRNSRLNWRFHHPMYQNRKRRRSCCHCCSRGETRWANYNQRSIPPIRSPCR